MGYIIGGYSDGNNALKDVWAFDSNSQSWLSLEDFPGEARSKAIVFVIDNKAYYGLGYGSVSDLLDDFWEFDPSKL